jgi:hypothetical protein
LSGLILYIFMWNNNFISQYLIIILLFSLLNLIKKYLFLLINLKIRFPYFL